MRIRWAMSVVVLAACCALVACGQASESDATSAGAPADVLAFATGSGAKLLEGNTFRFELQDRGGTVEYKQFCNPGSDRLTGAIDLGRKLAFFDLTGGGDVDVVVSEHTAFIRSSVLHGWAVDGEWLSVPMDDLQHLNMAAITTGLKVGPDFWQRAGSANPASRLDAMSDSVTSVSDEGPATVRGTDTTHYELTIDPAKAGLWTGGTTTTTDPSTSTTLDVTTRRQRFLDQIAKGGEVSGPIPDDVRAAFLSGDIDPLVAFLEQTTSTTIDTDGRNLLEAVVADDLDAFFDAEEETTGTTMDAQQRLMMRAVLGASGPTSPGEMISGLFNDLTTYQASAYVDGDGVLHRLDLRVGMTGATTTSTEGHQSPMTLDVTTEYWDIGVPLADGEPPPPAVTAMGDLPAAAIPAQLSPCYVRLDR